MLTLDTDNIYHAKLYAHSLYELFHDCARDNNITGEMSDNTLSGRMFGLPRKVFLKMLTEWSWRKYFMYIRFIHKDDGAVKYIQIAWDQLDEEDTKIVLLNMYPVAETQQEI